MKMNLRYVRVHLDRKTGKQYGYVRRRGQKLIRLPGLPGSAEFVAAAHAVLRGEDIVAVAAAARQAHNSINAVVAEYVASEAFKHRLPSENSRTRQIGTLRQWCALPGVGATNIAVIDHKYCKRAVAEASSPQAGYTWLITVRQMCDWAVDKGMIEVNPTAGIKVKREKSEGHATWSEAQIAQFEAHWAVGTFERLLFSLLLYTGQRCSDVRDLGRHSIIDGSFFVKQKKTGVEVFVPVMPELARVLAAHNVVGIHSNTFLATKTGKQIDQGQLNECFRKACDAAGLPTSCVPHGLRKAFCRRLAEAGRTPHEIAALSGHLTLKEVERYTRAFDRREAGKRAMAALVAGRAA